jgi:hypothetical protein
MSVLGTTLKYASGLKSLEPMFQRRETGSVVLSAPRERVLEILCEGVDPRASVQVEGVDRLVVDGRDGARSTFVLRDEPGGGTRLIHARAEAPSLRTLFQPESRLREAIEADLFRIQRLVGAPESR